LFSTLPSGYKCQIAQFLLDNPLIRSISSVNFEMCRKASPVEANTWYQN
jgi:hypothetical protein